MLTHKKSHLKSSSSKKSIEVTNECVNPDLDVTLTESDELTPFLGPFGNQAYQDSDELMSLLDSDMCDKQEHVININSDDEEYTTCTVVVENLFGSARTDYKSNHVYIEKYRSKRKNQKEIDNFVKRIKSLDYEQVGLICSEPTRSFSSSSANSSLDSVKSSLKQRLTSKQQRNRPISSSLSFDADYVTEYKDPIKLTDNSEVCFINCLES